MSYGDDGVALDVGDDGHGFAAEEALAFRDVDLPGSGSATGGFGLTTCGSGPRRVGGVIQVDSSGEGTVVHVEVPRRRVGRGGGRLMPIRLMLVDDHPVVRDGLHGVFAADEDFEVVAEAGDGQEALARAARVEVDVVLLDLRMPRMGGVETIRALATQAPGVRVLVLTTFDTDRDVLPAIEAGATGYLLKDASAAELKAAVRAAYAGQPVLAPSVAGRLIGQVRRGPDLALSPREVEVLRLVAAGTTNRETARRLLISEATVKTHLLHLYEKLGVNDRAAAVSEAYQRGLLS